MAQQQKSNKQPDAENYDIANQNHIYEEGTGDNIERSVNDQEESYSIPKNIENLPAKKLVVNLNDNMIDTYSSLSGEGGVWYLRILIHDLLPVNYT